MIDKATSRTIERAISQPSAKELLPRSHVILSGEIESDYRRIEEKVFDSVKPMDFIEEIWVRDITDLTWDALRFRRMRGDLIQAEMLRVMDRRLMQDARMITSFSIIGEWLKGGKKAKENLEAELKKINTSIELCYAEALSAKLVDLEGVDRLVAGAESRRNNVLKEISRHRDALAKRLAEVVEDAKYTEVRAADRQGMTLDGQPE